MKHSKKEIAKLFSNGKFKEIFPYLNEKIIWNVIGENIFIGKENVINNCVQTDVYFKSVQTDFKINDIIESDNTVVIIGTAEFLKDGKRINFISACDVYEFNTQVEIVKISSYCISETC